MSKPKLLDLFCCAGGAAMGYHRAGFDVVGVDHTPQPRYPFPFHRADALDYLAEHGHKFDAIHASPPCQRYSVVTRATGNRDDHPDLVAPVRELLTAFRKPWAIENVPGAPLQNPIVLCGTMFPGLRVYRHRLFESNVKIEAPAHPKHVIRSTGTQRGRKAHYEAGGFITITGDVGVYCGGAMEIDWMNGNELSQAIPPAYTEFVGKFLLQSLER
jgi:DNA (cytosine-5)-methyltransferase 1